jgi:uncharacterized protein YdhG (YjbR/CyaY superfamily)
MMKTRKTAPKDIDAYIAAFPTDVQEKLQAVRASIRKAAPRAEETISYGIPTFKLNGGYLIYFAGYKKHIAIYPVPGGDAKFKEEVAPYQTGKGTLQFPLDQPMPLDLIRNITKFSIQDNLARAKKGK